MCQATGYKLTSNKELPGSNLPFLEEYYPANNSSSKSTPNQGQLYPHYIIWNIGKGKETETELTFNCELNKVNTLPETTIKQPRERILGHAKKIWNANKDTISNAADSKYKYNSPILLSELKCFGGNGITNSGSNNIIIEKL